MTASDPASASQQDPKQKSLDASDPAILRAPYGAGDTRWAASDDHYRNWLEAVASRTDPIAPVDQATRSLEACAVAWIGMKLGRKLAWDPVAEVFRNDAAANALCRRTPRSAAYDIARVMEAAGFAARR